MGFFYLPQSGVSPKGLLRARRMGEALDGGKFSRISGSITSSDGYENKNLTIDRNILNLLFTSSS